MFHATSAAYPKRSALASVKMREERIFSDWQAEGLGWANPDPGAMVSMIWPLWGWWRGSSSQGGQGMP